MFPAFQMTIHTASACHFIPPEVVTDRATHPKTKGRAFRRDGSTTGFLAVFGPFCWRGQWLSLAFLVGKPSHHICVCVCVGVCIYLYMCIYTNIHLYPAIYVRHWTHLTTWLVSREKSWVWSQRVAQQWVNKMHPSGVFKQHLCQFHHTQCGCLPKKKLMLSRSLVTRAWWGSVSPQPLTWSCAKTRRGQSRWLLGSLGGSHDHSRRRMEDGRKKVRDLKFLDLISLNRWNPWNWASNELAPFF